MNCRLAVNFISFVYELNTNPKKKNDISNRQQQYQWLQTLVYITIYILQRKHSMLHTSQREAFDVKCSRGIVLIVVNILSPPVAILMFFKNAMLL